MAMTKTVRWQRMERNGGLPNSLEQQAKLVDLISQVVEKKDSLSVLFDALTSVEAFNKGIRQAASIQYPSVSYAAIAIRVDFTPLRTESVQQFQARCFCDLEHPKLRGAPEGPRSKVQDPPASTSNIG
jgi:hypothetical protein